MEIVLLSITINHRLKKVTYILILILKEIVIRTSCAIVAYDFPINDSIALNESSSIFYRMKVLAQFTKMPYYCQNSQDLILTDSESMMKDAPLKINQPKKDHLISLAEALLNNRLTNAIELTSQLLSDDDKDASPNRTLRLIILHCSLLLKSFASLSTIDRNSWKGRNHSLIDLE